MKIDVKSLEHIHSDDKTTTLRDKDGHSVTIAHNKLSKENQEKLKAMAPKSIKAKTADEGVDKANKRRSEDYDGSPAGEVIEVNKDEKKGYGKVTDENGEKPQVFADGGMVEDSQEPQQDLSPMMPEQPSAPEPDMMAGIPTADTPSVAAPAPPVKNPILSDSIERYNLGIKAAGTPNYQSLMLGPNGEPGPGGINPDMWDTAKAQAKAQAQDKDLSAQQHEKLQNEALAKQNAARIELGQPPLSTPSQPTDPNQAQTTQGQLNQGVAPALPGQLAAQAQQVQTGTDPLDPSAGIVQGYNTQIQGIQENAKAQGDLGKAQAAEIEKTQLARQKAQDTFEQNVAHINEDMDKYTKDIQNGYIDPNKYWTGYTAANGDKVEGHSKMAAGIGMLLAGFNPTSRPNAVQEMMNKEIDRSIDAQKTNLNTSHNLLRANLDRFKNAKDATDMTRVMLNDGLLAQLQSAAAKAQTPMAQAQAKMAMGPLMQAQSQLKAKVAMNQTVMKLANDPNGQNADSIAHTIGMMRAYDPERAKELESRFVPGIGLSPSTPIPQDVRQELIGKQNFQKMAQHYVDWVKKNGGTLNPAKVREGATMAADLQGAYRQASKGGVYKEGEQEFIERLIPSNPDQFASSIRTLPKLQSLIQSNDSQFNTLKQGYGLPVSKSSQAHPNEGKIAVNDKGNKLVMTNGRWVPVGK